MWPFQAHGKLKYVYLALVCMACHPRKGASGPYAVEAETAGGRNFIQTTLHASSAGSEQ